MKADPLKQGAATKKSARPGSETEKTTRRRAAALAGISPPSAGEISKSAWDEFNRELDALGNRPPRPVPDPSKAAKKSAPETESKTLMNPNPLKQGMLTENSVGIGTVTRKMVRERAVELAVINGRPAQEASKSDWDEAKRELTGEPEMDPQDAILESASEAERWDPVQGSIGHKMPESSSEDEDEEGRSDSERLVEEGVAEAGHDQMLQAAKTWRPGDGEK